MPQRPGTAPARGRPLPSLVLVVGPRNSGKTAYARILVERARAAGRRVAGFLSEAEWEGDVKARFFLRDLARPDADAAADAPSRTLLASVQPGPGLVLRAGPYHLSSTALEMACEALRQALDADLICIDELGPLEMQGDGYAPALRFLLSNYRGILLLTTRPSVAKALLSTVKQSDCPALPGPA